MQMESFLIQGRACLACHKPLSQHLPEWPQTDGCTFAGTKEAGDQLLSFCLVFCTRLLGPFPAMRGKPLSQVSLSLKGMSFFCVY